MTCRCSSNIFLDNYCHECGLGTPVINHKVIEAFSILRLARQYPELENCLERALMLSGGKETTCEHLPRRMFTKTVPCTSNTKTVKESLHELIVAVLARTKGNVSQAARELNISRSTLYAGCGSF